MRKGDILKDQKLIDSSESKYTGDTSFTKADNDEEIFALRSQDYSSPKIVILWIAENIETISYDKAKEALDCAFEMRNWSNRKNPD